MALQHLRSSTANKRPDPTAMAEGQLALNTANASPGLFYKDATGSLIKSGPVHIGATAPNATPAAGGHAGNSVGEAWLDTSGTNPLLKIYNGAAFVTVQPVASGTVVSTADTGTVTSTMILDGTILNADINASAAIVDTKLATIATGGKVSNRHCYHANTASAIVARMPAATSRWHHHRRVDWRCIQQRAQGWRHHDGCAGGATCKCGNSKPDLHRRPQHRHLQPRRRPSSGSN
jgi:hypothetical protein